MRGVLIALGVALVIAGLLWPWLGHLPGDLRFGQGTTRVYIPLGSSLVFSVIVSLLLTLLAWFLR